MLISRRRAIEIAGASALATRALPSSSWAQPAPPRGAPSGTPSPLPALNRFPRMVHEAFVARVGALEAESLKVQAAISTRAEAEAYVAGVRKKIRGLFGPTPPRTPLDTRTTGRLERDAYVVEKLIFESRPNFPVTANLYIPSAADGSRPPA